MTELVLYTNPMSRGRIARWALEEVGQPYRVVNLEYGPDMHSESFLALNPMGKVPVLTHGDAVVTETAAICAYLAETFSESGLGPNTPVERALFLRWLFFCAGPLEAAIINRTFQCEPPREKARAIGYGTFELAMETLEKAIAANDYIAGSRFTLADVYVGSQIGFGLQFGTIQKSPVITSYWERIAERHARLRATALDDAAATPKA